MAFWDLFSNRSKKEKLSHLKNLVVVMLADGKISKSELGGIAAVMSREGLTEDDLHRCMENPESIDFVIPDSEEKKLQYIHDMVLLMMIDGHIDDDEFIVCKVTAEALGYRHEVVDAIILKTIADVKREMGI